MRKKLSLLALVLMVAALLSGCGLLGKKEVTPPSEPVAQTQPAIEEEKSEEVVAVEEAKPEEAKEESKESDIPSAETESTVEEPLPPPSITQMELILDASGSMWGQVEGKAKIDVAKEAMGQIIDDLEAKENLEVALRIYAHQNKECTNSVVEFPMGKVQADAMKSKIKDIKPLGMTPIYYSLMESVKDFKKDLTGEKVVVLVTDGLESCDGDPCAAAKALKDGGVVSKIHIVGFGMTAAELETLKCIAEPSGGLVVGAKNATEFMGAMEQIMKKTLNFNLELIGKTKKDESVLMKVTVTQNGKEVAKGQGDHVQLMLPAGTYDIEAESFEGLGTVNVKGITVTEDKETKKEILFAKTAIMVNVVGTDGKPLDAKDLCVYKAGETENEVKCAGTFASKYEFRLQPGDYDVHAVNAATDAEAWVKGISLKDGDEVQKTISFAQGSIKVNVIGADGEPLDTKDLCVFPAGKTDKETECAGTFTDNFEFKLTPGIYDVRAVNADTDEEAWVKAVEVKATETTTRVISFEQGSIMINVVGADGEPLEAKDLCVFPAGETKKEIKCAGTFTDNFEFKLTPGIYDVSAASFGTSEEKWIKGLEVKATETVSKSFTFDQGTLETTVTDAQGTKMNPEYSICVYPQGETKKEAGCAGTFTNTFKFTLKPGTYDLKAKNYKTQEEKWVKGVEIKAAEETTQDIVY